MVMQFDTYEEYILMEKSLTIEEMDKLYKEMITEIGKDEDALELYEELVVAANKYSTFRANWCTWSREEKMDKDASRSACHDSMIVKFNKLARYLKMQEKEAAWREVLGDVEEHPYNRKRIGDFACYIVFVNSICAR